MNSLHKKKIIFSNYDDIRNPYYGGGGAVAIHEITKRLSNEGYEVTVITGKYPGSKNESIENVFYKRIGISFLPPKISQLVFQFLLPLYVIKEKYDIWFESFTPPFSTAFLPIFTKKPIVGVTQLLAGREISAKYKIPFYFIENLGLKLYKNIVVLNENIRDQVLKVNPNLKASIIPNGISEALACFEYDKDGEQDYLLFLGRIDIEQKGLDLLIESFDKIKNQTRLDLIIAGGGTTSEIIKLEKGIKSRKLTDRVKYVGKVIGEEKDNILKKAKMFVMPSRYEGFPLSLLEAFGYKCASIYFNINQLKFIPKDVAIKVDTFDINEFSNAILLLDRDKELRNKIASNAKEYSQRFTWEKISLKYSDIIRELTEIKDKKIQFFFDYFYPSIGGVQHNNFETYSRLLKLGWEVECVTTKSTMSSTKSIYKERENINGISVKRYNYYIYKFFPFLMGLNLREGIICLHDFITFPYYYYYFVKITRKMLNLKTSSYVLSSHGLFGSPLYPYKGYTYIIRKIKRMIDRSIGVGLVNLAVDKIRAVSVMEKNRLIEAGIKADLIEVINNGVDIVNFSSDKLKHSHGVIDLVATNTPYVLQIGRIDRFKNYEEVIKALPYVDEKIKYLIVGPMNDRKYVHQLIELVKELNLIDRVIFTGEIIGADKYYLIKESMAYLQMSHYEGYGNVINEAMSQGVICITSNNMTPEIITSELNGFRIELGNTSELANRLNDIYLNGQSSKYIDIKRRALEDSKDRSWDKIAGMVSNLFEEVLQNKKYEK